MPVAEKLNLLSQEELKQFRSNGYIIVPDVYTPDEILTARELFDTAFKNQVWQRAPYSSPQIINDIYRVFPGLPNIIFNSKYVNALKDIFGGQLVCVPEASLHRNRYYDWHKDSSQMESEGSREHWAGEDFMVQCCTYFQDNEPGGGGMTAIPGSHTKHDRFIKIYSEYDHHRLYHKLLKLLYASPFDDIDKNEPTIRLPSKAGDLIIFDIRLDHRATFIRKRSLLPKRAVRNKYAVFNAFAKPGKLPREYLAKLKAGKGSYIQYLNQTTCAPVMFKRAAELGFEIYA
jgi:hypothetical protein